MEWSEKWALKFNSEKCKIMHIGHEFQTEYQMADDGKIHKLKPSQVEKDLGIYVADNLKLKLKGKVYTSCVRSCLIYGSETWPCLLYTSPSPRDGLLSRMPSSA